jgi:hypothetical protein
MPRPPATLTLEDEEIRFYAAIGKTMMQWQAVETSLSNIFCALVGPPGNSGLANIAFYSTESFRPKLNMTNNVVTARFSFIPDRISEWPSLANRTKKRSDRRNAFAHYGMEVDQKAKAGYRYRLRPSPNSLLPDITTGYNPSAYRLCDIIIIGNSFETLATDLTVFFEKIRPRVLPVASPL